MTTIKLVLMSSATVLGLTACGGSDGASSLPSRTSAASTAPINCAVPESTADMFYCARLAYDAADKRLNNTWPEVTAHFATVDKSLANLGQVPVGTTPSTDLIVSAQLAWIDFRDNDCVARTSVWSDGSFRKVALHGCKTNVTIVRTQELRQIVDEPAGQPLTGSDVEFARIQSTLSECKEPSSNVEIKFCLSKTYEEADRLLNSAYSEVKARLRDPKDIEALTKAELAWIRLRDSECTARVRANWGGSGYSGFLATCLASRTILRTAELRTQFDVSLEGAAE